MTYKPMYATAASSASGQQAANLYPSRSKTPHNQQHAAHPRARTLRALAAFLFVWLLPLAGWAQTSKVSAKNHSTEETKYFEFLYEAINDCTPTSSTEYTITLLDDCEMKDNATVHNLATITIEGNNKTVLRPDPGSDDYFGYLQIKGIIVNNGTITINDLIYDGCGYLTHEGNLPNGGNNPFDGFLKNALASSKATLTNCTIKNVYMQGVETAAITNFGNEESGGGLFMTDCTITNCGSGSSTVSKAKAGGICNLFIQGQDKQATAKIEGCTFENCTMLYDSGLRGAAISNCGKMEIKDCKVTSCSITSTNGNKTSYGHCINNALLLQKVIGNGTTTEHLYRGELTFTGENEIYDNLYAGGIVNQGRVVFANGSNTKIHGNGTSIDFTSTTTFFGGGINNQVISIAESGGQVLGPKLETEGSATLEIYENKASQGGGIYNTGTVEFTNAGLKKIYENTAVGSNIQGESGRGGGICNTIDSRFNTTESGTLKLTSCIIGGIDDSDPSNPISLGNEAKQGAGIFSVGIVAFYVTHVATLNFEDSQCSYNVATEEGGGIYIGEHSVANLTGKNDIHHNSATDGGGGMCT